MKRVRAGRPELNRATFRQPPAQYRELPFWSWNDELNDDELVRQIAGMAEGGCGGFFIHARVGLETSYLSEVWLRRVRTALEAARAYGLQAWLYDEEKWPSGFAGGLSVAANSAHRAMHLVCHVGDRPAMIHERIAAFSARAEGDTLSEFRHFEAWEGRDPAKTASPDLVKRQFSAAAPNHLWVADITQHMTAEGWLYLAVVVDVFSRKVVGWAMSGRLYAELVVNALDMALKNRRPGEGLIHHSDHGSQYTSFAFGEHLQKAGLLGSMGTVGDALDNAIAESFFSTLQAELLDQWKWATRADLRLAIFDYIEVYFNRQRLHSTLGYLSPAEFEMNWQPAMEGDKLMAVH